MHQSMQLARLLIEDDKLFKNRIAMPLRSTFSSAASIKRAGSDGIAKYLRSQKISFSIRRIDRVTVWASSPLTLIRWLPLLTDQ